MNSKQDFKSVPSIAFSLFCLMLLSLFGQSLKLTVGSQTLGYPSVHAHSAPSAVLLSGNQTTDVAWADVDGDGDLDLAIAVLNEPNRIHFNQSGELEGSAGWVSTESDTSSRIAWGDVDGDGDLDMAVANSGPNRLYLNDGGALETSASWSSDESDSTASLAWGDVDGDGDLDLAVANNGDTSNRVYLNNNGTLETSASWSSDEADSSLGVDWGDVDGDGDLDLAVGNIQFLPDGAQNRIYFNENGTLETTASWVSSEADSTDDVAWADIDGDGDLDLGVANRKGPNRIYLNENGTLANSAGWTSDESESSSSLDWGDIDNDGDLDLAISNYDIGEQARNRVYLNQDGALETTASWSSDDTLFTYAVRWGDVDNDGDLDLAAGNYFTPPFDIPIEPNRIYLNQDGVLGIAGQAVEETPTDLTTIAEPETEFSSYYLPLIAK